MATHWTRRGALLGGLSVGASALSAAALDQTARPVPRPGARLDVMPVARPSFADLIARANLGGTVGFEVRDVATGQTIARHDGGVDLPPASVTKAVTTLYALQALGENFRFKTEVYVTSPLVDGVVNGDLILAGSGDPDLVTDDLVALREALLANGLREVRGRFLVWGGAIDRIAEIEPSQLDHLGYNPSVGGLNLNQNRVHFEWERRGTSYRVQMDARGRTEVPLVRMSKVSVVDRNAPVFAYTDGGGEDRWTVARSALNTKGSRWLPVRYPAIYTGDVFRSLMVKAGVVLPAPIVADAAPEGIVLARHYSPRLPDILKLMLDKSTNLTAEVAGLTASDASSLRSSAAQMTEWAQAKGAVGRFMDHSGLSDQTRLSAGNMVNLLLAEGVPDRLYPLLKAIPFLDEQGRPVYDFPAEVRAKTGTLNFVTTLAGYLRTAGGGHFAFAIFAADLESREASKTSQADLPQGAAQYNTRARALQQALLRHVVRVAGG